MPDYNELIELTDTTTIEVSQLEGETITSITLTSAPANPPCEVRSRLSATELLLLIDALTAAMV